jgi:hypothetical protein
MYIYINNGSGFGNPVQTKGNLTQIIFMARILNVNYGSAEWSSK